MKKTALLLALGLASTQALAADEPGTIQFSGTVYAGGTCQVEVVSPGGSFIPAVAMGNYPARFFDTIGKRSPAMDFALKVTPDANNGCTIPPGSTASVKFDSIHGVVDTNLYALRKGGANGIGMVITDDLGNDIDPSNQSRDYDLFENQPTEMRFTAAYQSYLAGVTEGVAEAQVGFILTLP